MRDRTAMGGKYILFSFDVQTPPRLSCPDFASMALGKHLFPWATVQLDDRICAINNNNYVKTCNIKFSALKNVIGGCAGGWKELREVTGTFTSAWPLTRARHERLPSQGCDIAPPAVAAADASKTLSLKDQRGVAHLRSS
jgi:hypothetical protein